ncbi:MAG: sulfotransferase family 2 domain-containing protein [Candidatus Woesearchaeota archaeon]
MISEKYKFIYIHIPKTGGNSIQKVLSKYSEDKVLWRESIGNVKTKDNKQGLDVFNKKLRIHNKHARIYDYYRKLGNKIHDYFIFASIRNPWDRVVSCTYFNKEENKKFKSRLKSLLKFMVGKEDKNFSYLTPMTNYVTINGRIEVDFFIRFENLQKDLDKVCDRLGIPKEKLPHKNQSFHKHYTEYYDERSQKKVAEKYKKDIKNFNYEFK